MTRPKPQLIQLAASDTSVTMTIACPGVFASLAMAESMRRKKGVLASTKPVTSTSTICMANSRSCQNPPPQ